MWDIHAMEYYLTIKKNEALIQKHDTNWKKPVTEVHIFYEISGKGKSTKIESRSRVV